MKEVLLLKYGELALKGQNRYTFEDQLAKNIQYSLRGLGTPVLTRAQSTMVLTFSEEAADVEEAARRMACVFGLSGYTRALQVEKAMPAILEAAVHYLREELTHAATFKVEAKRADKKFPLNSPEICVTVGDAVAEAYPHLKVNVKTPDVRVMVEIRDYAAFVHAAQQKGAGGMPVGTAGRAALLISGGIDSPVAGYMMAKRGLALTAIHFASPPYTSEMAEQKVHDLLQKVARYSGPVPLLTVPFTRIQEVIRAVRKEGYFTLLMRRAMMRIACTLAQEAGAPALITGESLGQVASQTLPALACTEDAANLPILRPLIGLDKDEIVRIARQIDTFDISTLPYEDCCTVFTPRHPTLRPELESLREAEASLTLAPLLEEAVAGVRRCVIA